MREGRTAETDEVEPAGESQTHDQDHAAETTVRQAEIIAALRVAGQRRR